VWAKVLGSSVPGCARAPAVDHSPLPLATKWSGVRRLPSIPTIGCPSGGQAKVITHSTMLIWPRLGSDRFRLHRLVQSLSFLTNLSILLYCGAPGVIVYIRTMVLAWKQEIFLLLGGTWDHLFTPCIVVTRGFNDLIQCRRSSRRARRSDLSCTDASGPRSSSFMWSSMAESKLKSPPPEFPTSIFIVDSPRLQPYVLPRLMQCTLCVVYCHTPRGWSRSQCDPCWG